VFGNVTRGLLASGSADMTIIMWKIVEEGGEVKATATRTLTGHTDYVRGIALSPDDVYVASASDDKTVRVWEVATGQPLRVLQGHTHWVLCAAWSRDGEWIASGSRDESVRVWRVDAQVPCMCVCMHVHVHVRRLHVRT
jgi:WD40 repeat protein